MPYQMPYACAFYAHAAIIYKIYTLDKVNAIHATKVLISLGIAAAFSFDKPSLLSASLMISANIH